MYFKINNGNCFVLATYSLESYCNTQLNALSTVLLTLAVTNTSFVSSASEFSAIDRVALSTVLSDFVSFIQPRDVKVVKVLSSAPLSSSSTMNITTIDVHIIINTVTARYDPHELTSMISMTTTAIESLQTAINTENTFYTQLKAPSAQNYNSTYFLDASGVTLVSIGVQDEIQVVVPAQMKPYATEVSADGSSFVQEA
jgi:hypothetical protein